MYAAAKQGHPSAQYRYGQMLGMGTGVKKDLAEASHWTELAARQGHADALFMLGQMYIKGHGKPKDSDMAIRLWQEAASRGHILATQSLNALQAKFASAK